MKKLFSFLFGRGQSAAAAPAAPRRDADHAEAADAYLLNDAIAAGATSLLIFSDGPGATQVISFDLPLRALRRSGNVSLAMVGEAAFDVKTPAAGLARLRTYFASRRPDIVIASRFAGLGAHALPSLCDEFNARLIQHLDDDLFSVPSDLGKAKFEKYADPARKNRLRLLCERAERVYVSTQPLKDRLLEIGVATPIFAGDFYCPAFAEPAPFRPSASPVFGYMGSAGHVSDLEMIAPAIAAVLDLVPDARFETFGSIKPPQSLLRRYPERVVARKAAASYEDFLRLLSELGWRCGLAPLAPTPFNKCKADTKFVEYSMAGIPTVASDGVVYRKALAEGRGVLAADPGAWIQAIRGLIEDPVRAATQVSAAQRWLGEAYAVERLEAQLLVALGLGPRALLQGQAPSSKRA